MHLNCAYLPPCTCLYIQPEPVLQSVLQHFWDTFVLSDAEKFYSQLTSRWRKLLFKQTPWKEPAVVAHSFIPFEEFESLQISLWFHQWLTFCHHVWDSKTQSFHFMCQNIFPHQAQTHYRVDVGNIFTSGFLPEISEPVYLYLDWEKISKDDSCPDPLLKPGFPHYWPAFCPKNFGFAHPDSACSALSYLAHPPVTLPASAADNETADPCLPSVQGEKLFFSPLDCACLFPTSDPDRTDE